MNVKNFGEFSRFCAENAGRDYFEEDMELIADIADTARKLDKAYRGNKQDVGGRLGDAILRIMNTQEELIDKKHEPRGLEPRTFELARVVLTKFWEFGDSARQWFDGHGNYQLLAFEDTNTDFAVGVEDPTERAVA